jgi:mono/diheme cytochrome c family protein
MNVARFALTVFAASAAGYFGTLDVAAPTARLGTFERVQGSKTVWDSVFTAGQATRGEALYRSACSSCHGPELSGNDDALPLTGPSFLANWNGQSLGDLFDKVRRSMPPDEPGALDAQQTVDVIAHVLNYNKFPAGGTELPNVPDTLRQIVIQDKKPVN